MAEAVLAFLLTRGVVVSLDSSARLTQRDVRKLIRLLECTADGLDDDLPEPGASDG